MTSKELATGLKMLLEDPKCGYENQTILRSVVGMALANPAQFLTDSAQIEQIAGYCKGNLFMDCTILGLAAIMAEIVKSVEFAESLK